MTRALLMVAILHYQRLWFGNSIFARMVKTPMTARKKAEVFGGIISTEDGSALTIGPTARPRTGCNNDSVNVLVDSGASGHYFDDAIVPGFRDKMEKYKVLDVPRRIFTTGGEGIERHCAGSEPGLPRRRQRSATVNSTFVSDCAWPRA